MSAAAAMVPEASGEVKGDPGQKSHAGSGHRLSGVGATRPPIDYPTSSPVP